MCLPCPRQPPPSVSLPISRSTPVPVHRPLRAVLDTNVVLDLFHFIDPRTLSLKHAIEAGWLRCYGDEACLDELQRVLTYPEFGLMTDAQNRLLAAYRGLLTIIDDNAADDAGSFDLPRCRDVDDQKFLTLAARSNADLLITRDKELLRLARRRVRRPSFAIVTPDDVVRSHFFDLVAS